MKKRKVVVLAFHDELESAYPPLNIAVGAAASGADVSLAFLRDGVTILDKDYVPVPSEGTEYLSEALEKFNAPTIRNLLDIAVESGVQLYVVDLDSSNDTNFTYPIEQVPIKWILNEAVAADLFVHF